VRRTPSPLGALARGLVAGAAGTAVMTGYQALLARIRSDEGGGGGSGNGRPADLWEEAPAPARVARRLIEGVLHRPVAPKRIGLLTTVTHWAYGTGCGALFGLVEGSKARRPLVDGLVFGTAVWAFSYATLVPLGIYDPPTEYPPAELAIDWSYHAVYGAAVAAAYRAIPGS
jgi:hypothetical protein